MGHPILLLLLGSALLFAGAEALVRGAAALGLRFGLPPLVVGATIVAFGTSAPELAVSLDAALLGLGDLAVGNVVGSNVCNIALILGLSALVRPVRVPDHRLLGLDVPVAIGASLALAGMLRDQVLSRPEGALLLAGIVGYTVLALRPQVRPPDAELDLGPLVSRPRKLGALLFQVVLGLGFLVVGATFFVDGATGLARSLGVSEAVIGLTVVAVGTSLPELATSLVAAARRQPEMAVGNVVGSNIFNVFAILGASALAAPLATRNVRPLDLGVMLVLSVALWPLLRSGSRLGRTEGTLLLASYVAYLSWRIAS